MLLDLLGPARRCSSCWPHDGAVAGGADSILVIFRFGATMELGRSERTTMRPLLRPRKRPSATAAQHVVMGPIATKAQRSKVSAKGSQLRGLQLHNCRRRHPTKSEASCCVHHSTGLAMPPR